MSLTQDSVNSKPSLNSSLTITSKSFILMVAVSMVRMNLKATSLTLASFMRKQHCTHLNKMDWQKSSTASSLNVFNANLSAGFWAEAALTATYLTNHSPVSHLPNMTPEQAWSGLKPQVTKFRPFGCPAYSHIPKTNCTKLESKTQKCVLVGYQVRMKAYHL